MDAPLRFCVARRELHHVFVSTPRSREEVRFVSEVGILVETTYTSLQ